jgi:hypothetical protein
MSESAATFKLFFRSTVAYYCCCGYTTSGRSEDRALLGSNPSADSGAKTKLGPVRTGPGNEIINWDWHQSDKSQEPGDGVPREKSSFYKCFDSSIPLSASLPFFRRKHVSALNFCMSLFRWSGFAIIIQPLWASCIAALTRASTKEPAARCAVRDKLPAW